MTPGGNNPTSGSAGPFAPQAAPAPAPAPAAAPANAPANASAARRHAGRMNTRRYMHNVVHHRRGMGGGQGMSQAEQLNAQELQRIQSGAPPAMAPMPMTPGGNNPTSGSAGPFAPPPPK
jgi:hypothetical protein